MPDLDNDAVRGAFEAFRRDALNDQRTPEIARVYAIARRRSRLHATVIALIVALALVAPAAAYAAFGPVGHRTPTGHVPPSHGATPTRSTTATPSATGTPTPSAPDGRINRAELGNTTLDLPAWPAGPLQCPSRVTLVDGKTTPMSYPRTELRKVGYTDVDHDGADETIAIFDCRVEGFVSQVVAFDRDSAGRIVTMGRVVAQNDDIENIFDIQPMASGSIRAEVGDLPNGCCGDDFRPLIQHQWRTYAWTGGAFRQIGGPTTFPPNPQVTDLALTADPVVFGAAVDGVRHGVLTLTVHNKGPMRAPAIAIMLINVPGYTGPSIVNDPTPLPAGQSRVYTFPLAMSRAPEGTSGARVLSYLAATDTGIPDLNDEDNYTAVSFTVPS